MINLDGVLAEDLLNEEIVEDLIIDFPSDKTKITSTQRLLNRDDYNQLLFDNNSSQSISPSNPLDNPFAATTEASSFPYSKINREIEHNHLLGEQNHLVESETSHDFDEDRLLLQEEVFFTNDDENEVIQQLEPGDNPAFDLIGLTQLRNDPQFAEIDGSGFSVAVIDTGINYDHPLLEPNYITGDDFVDRDNDPRDDDGHGTHVAGTVGAADETIGVAPDAGIIGLDVFGTYNGEFGATVSSQIEALEWVLANHEEHNITAVNMSLGGGAYSSEENVAGDPRIELINRLEREGIVVVAATGNSYIEDQTLNAGVPSIFSTLAVGAVWQDDQDPLNFARDQQIPGADRVAYFSQRLDSDNFILAPGTPINSTSINGGFQLMPGTSMASPHVAGAVALIQEAALEFGGRTLTTDEVVELFRSTADTVEDGDDEEDTVTNTGLSFPRLNIYNAVVELKNRFDGIAPTPPPEDDDDDGDDGDDEPEPPIANDPNGTIAGAFIGPTLDGEQVEVIDGTIGIDGNGTNVGDKDVDLFRFEVDSPGLVRVELGTREDAPADFDTYLRIFNEEGVEIAVNDDIDPGIEQFSRIETELEPGTYYAGVSGFNNGSYDPNVAGSGISAATGNYSIEFELENSDPNGLISGGIEVLLGNDREPLIFPGFIGADYGEPVGVADVDLYRIVVPDDGSLFLDIDTPYEDNYVDSFLRIFSEEGEELFFTSTGEPAESDDDLGFDVQDEPTEFLVEDDIVLEEPNQTTLTNGTYDEDDNYVKGNYGHRTDSFLGVSVNRGDVYYVGVSDYFNSDYDPRNLDNRLEIGDGGSYELIATFANNDIDGSISQITSTTDLPLLDAQGNIGNDQGVEVGTRDVDFWKFNSDEEGILEIKVDSTEVNGVASLFDSNGRLLGENDGTNEQNPLLQYKIEPNEDYFVAVTGFGNQNFDPFAVGSGSGGETGEYTINANLLESDREVILSDNSLESESIQNVTLDRAIAGSIGEDGGFVTGANDIDLYRFTPESNSTIDIQVNASEAFNADTFLRLFDSEGNEIAFNNDKNDLTRGSFLQQEVTADTEYVIGINGNSENARDYNPITGEGAASGFQGDYTLTLTEAESEPDPDPDPEQTIELFRFRNTSFDTGTYVFVGEGEKDNILADENLSSTFSLDGEQEDGTVNPAFTASTTPGEGLIPFYRLKSLDVEGTFLFVSDPEYDAIFAPDSNQRDKWEQEGLDEAGDDIPEFYLYDGSADSGTVFNRFQNTQNGTFLYAGAAETSAIESDPNLSDLFTNQGVAFKSLQ